MCSLCLCHIQARLALVAAEGELKVPFADELPSRQAQLAALQNTEEFDVLVVGGGATGVGCALDAVTRSKLSINTPLLMGGNAALKESLRVALLAASQFRMVWLQYVSCC